MREYPKIQTVFKRDPETKYKTLLKGEYAKPEFAYLANNQWMATEKVDGTNIRIMYRNGTVDVGGKTDKAQIPAPLLVNLTQRFTAGVFEPHFGAIDVCLYGEGYGAKIQSGGNYRPDQDFVLFDVKVGDYWLQYGDVLDVGKKLYTDVVPLVILGNLTEIVTQVSEGFYSHWGDFVAEGLVARPAVELFNRKGERVITKIKYKDWVR